MFIINCLNLVVHFSYVHIVFICCGFECYSIRLGCCLDKISLCSYSVILIAICSSFCSLIIAMKGFLIAHDLNHVIQMLHSPIFMGKEFMVFEMCEMTSSFKLQ